MLSPTSSHMTTLSLTSTSGWDSPPVPPFKERAFDPFMTLPPLVAVLPPSISHLLLPAFRCAATLVKLVPLFTSLERLIIDLNAGRRGFQSYIPLRPMITAAQHALRMAPHLAALAAVVPETVLHLSFVLIERLPENDGEEDAGNGLSHFAGRLIPFAGAGNCAGVGTIAFPESGVERLRS